jgi:hypothetical protein
MTDTAELIARNLEARLAQAVTYVTNMVSAGAMTEAQGKAYMDDIRAQTAKAILGVEEKTGLTPAEQDPRRAAPIDKPALTLYAESLKREGMSDKQVLDLVTDAAAVPETAIQDRVQKELAQQQADADAKQLAKFSASPEGLAAEARVKRATDAVHAAKLEDGKTILGARGFSPEDVAMLRDDEIIRYSGIDPEIAGPDQGRAGLPSNMIEGA